MSVPLTICNISKKFKGCHALNDISLNLAPCQVRAIVGESGCGKTTLMRIIAGHECADTGIVIIHGKDKTNVPPEKRNIGLVFQDYALFPHLTIEKNIGYGLKRNKKARVKELLELINLPDIAKRYPHELSGGQQQRVAIARALAPQPSLLLLDEPFSNLDPIRRKKLRSSIRKLVVESFTSALIVTHDIEDALKVADSITVIKDGVIVQTGTPDEIVNSPANDYVRDLLD